MTLWAMLASPLLIGCDMSRLDPFTISLLCNAEVNDINQDPLGVHAFRYYHSSEYATYVKQLEDGSMAVAMFNISSKPMTIGFIPNRFGFRGKLRIRDLWRQKDVAEINPDERFDTNVNPHGVAFMKIYPGNSRERITGKPTSK